MFNDERINAESGKIYQRGILYATLVALMYGLLHGIFLIVTDHFRIAYLYTELAIVLCGAIILIVGAVRFPGDGDERMVFDKHNYFLRAGKTFIVVALAGYAVTIPFAGGKNFGDMPINHIILVLMALGYIYFFYTFKTRGICFNYTFIAEDTHSYYRAVFVNIGKLAVALFVAFGFAAVLDLGINRSFGSFLSILWGYLVSVVGLGLEYWFISWLEKRSYDEEDSERLKSSTTIAFFVLFGIQLISYIIEIVYIFLSTGNLMSLGGRAGAILASLSQSRIPMDYAVSALVAVALCFLLTQLDNAPRVLRAVKWVLGVSSFAILYSVATSWLYTILLPMFDHLADPLFTHRLMNVINLLASIVTLIKLATELWLAYCLIKEVKLSSLLLIPALAKGVLLLVDTVFDSATLWRATSILSALVGLGSIVLTFALLNTHKFSPTFTEDEAE